MRSTDRYATPDSAYPPQTPTERRRSGSRGSLDGSQFGADALHRAYLPDPAQTSQGFQPATPTSAGHPKSSFPVPSGLSNNGPTGTSVAPQHLSFAHPGQAPAPTSSSGKFAVPLPPVARPFDRSMPGSAKPHLPQLPNPAAMAQNLAPELDRSRANHGIHLPALFTGNQPSRPSGTIYDPTRRRWNLPEKPASSAKRRHSPPSAGMDQSLKQGMRPDHLVPVTATTGDGSPLGNIEADSEPYNNTDDDDQYSAHLHGFMEYRRACGRSNRKPVPNLSL